jgi:long-subunit acyl-CoA synthetase (AMP-forming)
VLLYVTIEEILGGEPKGRNSRPAQEFPSATTLGGLYDQAMRHHQRPAVSLHWEDGRLEPVPDWKFDRLVIRVALYMRERLKLEPGERVAIFGRSSRFWPVAEFAALGFGMVAVGVEHDVDDGALTHALAEARPRAVIATDEASASRLLRFREAAALPEFVIGPDGSGEGSAFHPLGRVVELGSTLDTPERAQAFRAFSRSLSPEAGACWHLAAGGSSFTRLTHREAMALVTERSRLRPARPADIAYVEAPRVTLAARLAGYAFVGDGCTTTAFGRDGKAAEDVLAVRPHTLLASQAWLQDVSAEVEAASDGPLRRLARLVPRSKWLRSLDCRGPRVRRALRARLGDRLRRIETSSPLASDLAASLSAAGSGGCLILSLAGEGRP